MRGHPTRRRLLAIATALLGAAAVPALAQTAKKKNKSLPDCLSKRTFGDWAANVDDISGHAKPVDAAVKLADDSVSSVGFNHYYKPAAAPSYELSFTMKRPPAATNFEVGVSSSDGIADKMSVPPNSMKKDDKGDYNISIDVGGLFLETNNPLKRAATITINASNSGAQLFSIEIRSRGFAEASQFLRTEQARLEQMEKRKQCESMDCFLTTACCELIGLDDDCFELRTLRAFRDGPLTAMPGGKDDIARYYRLAPTILAGMRRSGHSQHLLRLYATHILPSAVAARLGLSRIARGLYTDMMRRLERRYLGLCKS